MFEPDLICLQETYLSANITYAFQIKTFLPKDRSLHLGKGW